MNPLFEGRTGEKIRKGVAAVLGLLALFLVVESISVLVGLRYIGTGVPASNTITVSGKGDAYAVPDIGDFSFSVVVDKPTVSAAQADATAKVNAVTAYLKGAGVDEKDIKTTGYSIYPQYEYQTAACPQSSGTPVYCPPGRQVLKGYEVRQTTEVKVRDTGKAGDLLAGVGSKGATEVTGLSFTVEDPSAVEQEARDKAIADAKMKADKLAKALGVSLVRVVSFNESSGGYPVPFYGLGAGAVSADSKAAAPEISTGENKTTSNVSVTYEIR